MVLEDNQIISAVNNRHPDRIYVVSTNDILLFFSWYAGLHHTSSPKNRSNGRRGIFIRLPENVNGNPNRSGRCRAVTLIVWGFDPSTSHASVGVKNTLSLCFISASVIAASFLNPQNKDIPCPSTFWTQKNQCSGHSLPCKECFP